MEHSLKVLLGGLLGTVAIFYFLTVAKRDVRPGLGENRTAGLEASVRRAGEPEAGLEDLRYKAEALDREVHRRLAIDRLNAFLFAVRKNRIV